MDPLSEALSLLKPRSFVSAGLDAGSEWSLSFSAYEGIKFNFVHKGTCWLILPGRSVSVKLERGDCFLLTGGDPFILASDPNLAPQPSEIVYGHLKDGIAVCEPGGDFFLIGSRFIFDHGASNALFGEFPSVILIKRDLPQAEILRWSIERVVAESVNYGAGSDLVRAHLFHVMFVQVLRMFSATDESPPSSWLRLLLSEELSSSVNSIHTEPQKKWTVQKLANISGMSRSAFAAKFKKISGLTPIDYLTRWRVYNAARKMDSEDKAVSDIALSVGYESEGAFRVAFQRVMGVSPKHYRRRNLT
ncbi:AraC family transcriptional regulator [Acetobacter okinawensis]|uniref:AraC family transcriptional regulator n=1 Tax=Acetobacter okinawensis TaxID=1076594 RepID=UPI001BACAF77|nr:AraC family transcriptional regulator [Acetobacter okinawensis]MBS0966469.1 AraC family transcriptional regulator [Acetobacter okinawensis]